MHYIQCIGCLLSLTLISMFFTIRYGVCWSSTFMIVFRNNLFNTMPLLLLQPCRKWTSFVCYMQDNVFVNVVASVQYHALAEKASDAFYKLSNTRSQIQAYVFDGIKKSMLSICFSHSKHNKLIITKCWLICYLLKHCDILLCSYIILAMGLSNAHT